MMTFQGLINYWTDSSMNKHSGSGGSVTITANQWCGGVFVLALPLLALCALSVEVAA